MAASAAVARLTRILAWRVPAEQYVLSRPRLACPRGILTHVLPNIWPTLLAMNLAVMGGAVLAEAGLSYWGWVRHRRRPPGAGLDAQATFTTALPSHRPRRRLS